MVQPELAEVAKSVIAPPPLPPLNTNSDNMVKEWDYWKRTFERYCRLAKLVEESDKIDVFYAFIGRDTEEYLRDMPNFAELNSINNLLEAVQSKYNKIPNMLAL